jgi:LysM repeat protein
MKKLLVAFCLFISSISIAQNKNLLVEGTAPDLYITHTVSPKEGFFSIGRLYNQAPKLIASFNKLNMDKGLAIGQTIKIPLNVGNMDLNGNTVAGETLVPLYHVVAPGETLFRISNNHSAKVEAIRQWNNLSADVIDQGKILIVGHLRVKNEQLPAFTALALATPTSTNATNESKPTADAVVSKSTPQTSVTPEQNQSVETATAVKHEEEKKEEEKVIATAPVEATQQPATSNVKTDTAVVVANTLTIDTTAIVAVKKVEEVKSSSTSKQVEPVTETPNTNNSQTTVDEKAVSQKAITGVFNEEGEFAGLYTDRKDAAEKRTGVAATFKSTSGWQDKKYYILINNIESGTIVKVSAGGKSVYAKVLGGMPEMKENSGVLLRISNAAASYLGIIDPKFTVEISY